VSHCLEHGHGWIRQVVCRLLGAYFGAVGHGEGLQQVIISTNGPASWIAEASCFVRLGQSFCRQLLLSEELPSSLATQLIKNLLYVGLAFYRHPFAPSTRLLNRAALDDNVDAEEDGASATSLQARQEEEIQENGASSDRVRSGEFPALHWIFRRLSFIARRVSQEASPTVWVSPSEFGANFCNQKGVVYRWFAGMAAAMQPEDLVEFLVPIIAPTFRDLDSAVTGAVFCSSFLLTLSQILLHWLVKCRSWSASVWARWLSTERTLPFECKW
jgi:hypothetical protein